MADTSLEHRIADLFAEAARLALGDEAVGPDFDPVVRPSKFADYQVNGALALGKRLGRKPREVAEAMMGALEDGNELLAATEIAGPGFVNCTINDSALADSLAALARSDDLGIQRSDDPQVWNVDYSGVNIAKSMHVGHLRSTIIGDALVRMLERKGETVVRQNHVGDWGTQFGMLIQYLDELPEDDRAAAIQTTMQDLDALYRAGRARFDADEEFKQRARRRVVDLQSGDPHTLDVWRQIVDVSKQHFERVYEMLGVTLTPADYRGESVYNDQLDDVVAELEGKGLLQMSDGALCAFPPGFAGRDGDPLPMIVRKSDGGYGYQATDLATIRHSIYELKGDRLLYLTDARQTQHFAMVFAVARQAGWLTDDIEAAFIPFGMVLGSDGRPFKTRSGETVALASLVDEAIERAAQAISERVEAGDEAERATIARAVGVGALKWADLSGQRSGNYVFDWERLLSFSGDTGPYVQYAAARSRSVLRRSGIAEADVVAGPFVVTEPAEHQLALALPELGVAVDRVLATYEPHHLATYIYDVADRFTTFYEQCPVLKAEQPSVRNARLALCALTARVLADGLDLLGIDTPPRM